MGVVGRGQHCAEVLDDLLDAIQQDLEEGLIGDEL